jgi:serine protease
MKKIFLILSLLVLSSIIMFSQKNAINYKPNTIIFKIKPENKSIIWDNKFTNPELEKVLIDAGTKTITQKFPTSIIPDESKDEFGRSYADISTIYEIKISTDQNIFEIVNSLKDLNVIEYAHPYYIPDLLYVPNDPLNVNDQWYIDIIKAYDAFDIHRGDTNFVVGITDTGIDIDHPDFIYNIAYNWDDPIDGIDNDNDGFIDNFRGWDLAENDNNPQADVANHGILVSGLCAPETDNGVGLTGSAFKCRFLPIKISDDDNILTMAYEGLVYAADHGCKVINCSWGSTAYMEMGQDIVNYATINLGALVIGACGNNHNEVLFYPASYDYVFSVAGTTELDQKWSPDNTGTTSGSTYNYRVDISAPGAMVYTAGDGGYTMAWGGTSFSAPIVAGAAALVWSYYPELNPLQVKEVLKISADNIDTLPDNIQYAGKLGSGRLNMFKALTMELSPSIVFEQIVIEDDRENNYENSDEVHVMGILTNYLNTANNLQINITCENPDIQILTSEINLGDLGTLENIDFESNPIIFKMLPQLDYNTMIMLKLDYSADNYNKTQYIEVFVKPSYKQLDANNITISIPDNGRLGYVDEDSRIGNGMFYLSFGNLFYDCGLIAGNNNDVLFSSVRQVTDFYTLEHSTKLEPGVFADQEILSRFNESNDSNSLGLEILKRAMAWEDEDYSNFIIIEYQFINNSTQAISNFYSGIFADWDLISPGNNKSNYDIENGLMYFWHTGTQSLYSGMQLLSNQNQNHYALDNVQGGDGNVDITDDFTDSEKFYMISNTNSEAGQDEDGNDVVGTISAGPLNIETNDTVTVAFALHTSTNLYNLKISAQKADYLYNEILHPSNIENINNNQFLMYPNPAKDRIELNLPIDFATDKVEISITDLSGKKVLYKLIDNSENKLELNFNFNSGIYIVKVKSASAQYIDKLIIQN